MAEIQEREEEERRKFLERIQEERKEVIGPREEIEKTFAPALPVEIFRPLPKKPSPFFKFFMRFLASLAVLSVLAGVSFGIYWFFFERQPPAPPPPIVLKWCENENSDIPENEWSKERCVPPPDITIPLPLISYDYLKDIEIAENQEILPRLSEFLKTDLEKNKIYWIIIKDTIKREVPQLESFLSLFQIETKEGFYEKLDPAFTLFIYPQEKGIRMGFVAKIVKTEGKEEKEELKTMLRFWEDTMENDFKGFFTFLGKDKPAVNDYFSPATYKGNSIRCQTYTLEDFGSCYSIAGDYFIFTSSLESMKKTIERIR